LVTDTLDRRPYVKIFYLIKPVIPRRLQILLRRILLKKQIKKYKNVWPIYPGSEVKPKNWNGWPDNKNFALVLTHDVELRRGHDKCKKLLELEKRLGFVSSFNFIPERYVVDKELREFIVNEGFEVGVHGLYHDGKLFQNKKIFLERAEKINHYLKDWNAVGFRSPAMHHNLDWIHKLDIEYDLSTFDTDPFEPHFDGIETIFPFIVYNKTDNGNYIELPYTLPQDHSVFIIFEKKNIDIWKSKLDWVAEKGGMVLLNTHPDYLNFENKYLREEYPVKHYIELLDYVTSRYEGKFWQALPKQVAKFCKTLE